MNNKRSIDLIDQIDQNLNDSGLFLEFKSNLETGFVEDSKQNLVKNILNYRFHIIALFSVVCFWFLFFNSMAVGPEIIITLSLCFFVFACVLVCMHFKELHKFIEIIVGVSISVFMSSIFILTTYLQFERQTTVSAVILILFVFSVFKLSAKALTFFCSISILIFFAYCLLTKYPLDWLVVRSTYLLPLAMGAGIAYFNERERRFAYLQELKLSALYKEVDKLSRRDELTGLFNRRHFNETISTEWSRANRSGQAITIILGDIDYFKQYNDHYGHLAGDDALKIIATALMESATRPHDTVCRYGGEEFILILPDTSKQQSLAVVNRLKAALAAKNLAHEKSSFKSVTMSLGVFSGVPQLNEPYEAALKLTDDALYKAKDNGRNQWVYTDDC